MKALDLFCGAGGASKGLSDAGFDITGVDIKKQPNYPFHFIKSDALTYPLEGFDLIWASPPCQAYTILTRRNKNADKWPRLIPEIRTRLQESDTLFVIENVVGAPLNNPILLCGTMFSYLRVLRHRLFEANFYIPRLLHRTHPLAHTFDRRKYHYGTTDEMQDFVQVTGGGNCSVHAARDAMKISWMNKKELNEAIPPAYSEYIGRIAYKILSEK